MKIIDRFTNLSDEVQKTVLCHTTEKTAEQTIFLNEEHPMRLLFDDRVLHSFVCSPSQLGELAAGWLYTAGYAFERVEISADGHTATAFGAVRETRDFAGAEAVDAQPREMLALFAEASDKYTRSHGIHECVIKGADWHILCTDIGRHNAIDKAVGTALRTGKSLAGATLFYSGRINEQTVEKALNCGIGCLMSKAVITNSALELAETRGLKVLFSVKDSVFYTK